MAGQFDTVLLPRLKKVVYSKAWKNGRPVARKGISHFIRYVRLESYEDALGNIEFTQSALRLPFADYGIRYMLGAETSRSATLLNVEKLSQPFDYMLSVRANGRTGPCVVDLPETFNFLIGLRVRTRRALYRDHEGDRHRYLVLRGRTTGGQETVVIWRGIEDWGPEDYEREREWVQQQGLTEGADVVYVNGDSAIDGARSLDPEFRRRMFEEVAA